MRKLFLLFFRLMIIAAAIFFGWKYYPEISGIFRRASESLIDLGDKGLEITEKIDAPSLSGIVRDLTDECRLPIAYSIGSIDSRFGISKEAVRSAALNAEDIWERSANTGIFEYSEGGIPVNLVYDERQAETERLKSRLDELKSGRERYDYLRTEYESLAAEVSSARDVFESLKSSYEAVSTGFSEKVAVFEANRSSYDKEVAKWNAKGGAPEAEYTRLSVESESLRRRADELNVELKNIQKVFASLSAARDSFNNLVSRINAAASLVNAASGALNERVAEYNHIAGDREEFVTGFYRSSSVGQVIEVFQFDSPEELALIIAHELGHAAGIGHAESDKSLMYPKTVPGLISASTEDLSLLYASCR